jgi:Putative adhesin
MSTVAQPAPQRRTPLPVRRALLVVAGLFALAAVAGATIGILDHASRHTTTERASYDGVRALVIDDASDVRLSSAARGAPLQVIAHVNEGLRKPERSAQREGDGTLRLSSSCPAFFGGHCDVDYEIRVPSGTLVRAKASSGDIVAENLSSTMPIELESSAGDVTATDVSAPMVRLSSSAGDVSARGLSAERVLADSSAGDVAVALAAPADRVLAHSSAGDVDVVVPDAIYRVDATSSAGDVEAAEVRTDPAAARTITANSSAGDVHVVARR